MDGQTDIRKTWHTDVGVPPNKQKIAENFNNFFASVGKELQKKNTPNLKKNTPFIWKKKYSEYILGLQLPQKFLIIFSS